MTVSSFIAVHTAAKYIDQLEAKIKSIQGSLKINSYKILEQRSSKITAQLDTFRDNAEKALKVAVKRNDLTPQQRKRLKSLEVELDVVKARFGLA